MCSGWQAKGNAWLHNRMHVNFTQMRTPGCSRMRLRWTWSCPPWVLCVAPQKACRPRSAKDAASAIAPGILVVGGSEAGRKRAVWVGAVARMQGPRRRAPCSRARRWWPTEHADHEFTPKGGVHTIEFWWVGYPPGTGNSGPGVSVRNFWYPWCDTVTL
jgi:hypothetical protein